MGDPRLTASWPRCGAWLYTATAAVLAPAQRAAAIIGMHLTSGLH
ncbi:MAG: hypothetical protein ACLQDY_26760 [Streptosporangiaceae bacterium]